jgi:hypothetical protein
MAATQLFSVTFDPQTWAVGGSLSGWAAGAILGVVAVTVIARQALTNGRTGPNLAIDSANFGFAGATISMKPNAVDRQVAYAIWVELATRKIGLPIDLDNDVLTELYDSWHAFFGVTRELIKTVPVTKLASPGTRAIVQLSVDVLNLGIRPHLTLWQARFRRWYDAELARSVAAGGAEDPQDIQRRFPRFADLTADLTRVNKGLVAYRDKMAEIVYGPSRVTLPAAPAAPP